MCPFPLTQCPAMHPGISCLDITAGPDGNLWASSFDGATVRQIAPGTGAVTTFPVSAGQSSRIAVGADGNLWLVRSGNLVRIDPAGNATDFPLGAIGDPVNFQPYGLAAGGDGAVWFTGADLLRSVLPVPLESAASTQPRGRRRCSLSPIRTRGWER